MGIPIPTLKIFSLARAVDSWVFVNNHKSKLIVFSNRKSRILSRS
jgi:hypothetical protein